MAWIKVEQSIRDNKKILDLSERLDIPVPYAIGLLVSLWTWGLDNTPSGSLDGVSDRSIARAADWHDGDPGDFVNALIASGLIDQEDGELCVHDWDEFVGSLIKRREADKQRKRNQRNASAECPTDVRNMSAGRPQDVREKSSRRVEKSRVDNTSSYSNNNPEDKKPEEDAEEIFYNFEHATPILEQAEICTDVFKLYTDICKGYPALSVEVSYDRVKLVIDRWSAYGENLDIFRKLFTKAQLSSYMRGENERGWKADFDWMLDADHMARILEGKYDDREPHDPDAEHKKAVEEAREEQAKREAELEEASRKEARQWAEDNPDAVAEIRAKYGINVSP